MPAELDRCVRDLKAKFIKDGIPEKEAEQKAWAICRSTLGYKKENKHANL